MFEYPRRHCKYLRRPPRCKANCKLSRVNLKPQTQNSVPANLRDGLILQQLAWPTIYINESLHFGWPPMEASSIGLILTQ